MAKKSTIEAIGYHNQKFISSPVEMVKGFSYKDLSTVMFTPTLGSVPVRVIQSWNAMLKPMNQKFTQIFLVNDEVGKAYEQMIDILKSSPELSKWKYVVTLEHDNCPPPDGLLKLYEDIEVSGLDAVGSLYWTKGEGGQPMIYGKMDEFPLSFSPWLPPPNSVAQCHGLGMGFTIFKMSMLLDPRWERPIFKTEQSYEPGKGVRQFTQDLRMFENAGKLGFKVGGSTRVLTGHYDLANDKMW